MITFVICQLGRFKEEIYQFDKLRTWTFEEVSKVYAVGGFLFVGTPSGLKILNIVTLEDSVKGVQLAAFKSDSRPVGIGYYKGVVYLGINKLNGPEIDVVNFTDGSLITSLPASGNIVSLAVSSEYLFVLTSLGIEVYNISNPKNPQNVANMVFSSGAALSMSVVYPYIMIALGVDGLVILKMVGSALQKVYEYKLPNNEPVIDVATFGSYVYIAAGRGGIKVINTTGREPLVGEIKTDKPASRAVIYEKFLFVSTGEGGLTMYSLSNPSSPTPVAYYSNGMFLYDIAVYSNFVALAFGTGGVVTLKSNTLR